jgi:uncharacterized membrane protein (UPF0182 family)
VPAVVREDDLEHLPGYEQTGRAAPLRPGDGSIAGTGRSARARPRWCAATHAALAHTAHTRASYRRTLGALAGLLWLGAGIYTDLLWFHEIGQDQVHSTTLGWKLLPPAVAGLGTACFVLANLALVERWTREAPGPARPALAKVWRYRRLLQPVLAAGCGLIAIQALPDDAWRLLLLWANRSDFGTEDPVFHRDAGLFVFSLPLHALVVGWLLATIVMAGGAAGAAYALAGAPRAARAHALGLAALLLLVAAWRVRLDRLQLVLPDHDGVLTGASYSEVAVRLPALGVFVALRPWKNPC